jgi:hypothetical protein
MDIKEQFPKIELNLETVEIKSDVRKLTTKYTLEKPRKVKIHYGFDPIKMLLELYDFDWDFSDKIIEIYKFLYGRKYTKFIKQHLKHQGKEFLLSKINKTIENNSKKFANI